MATASQGISHLLQAAISATRGVLGVIENSVECCFEMGVRVRGTISVI